MKSSSIFIFLIILSSILLSAENHEYGDHLEPTDSYFFSTEESIDYYSNLTKLLYGDDQFTMISSILLSPSFTPEQFFYINEKEENEYEAVHKIPSEEIYFNDRIDTVQVEEIRKPISYANVELLNSLFSVVMAQIKYYNEDVLRCDGTHYYFNYNFRSGKIHSPPKKTNMGRLAGISEKLIEIMRSDSESIEFTDYLKEEITSLIEDLKSGKEK